MTPLVAAAWRAAGHLRLSCAADGARSGATASPSRSPPCRRRSSGWRWTVGLWHPTDTGVSAGGSNWSDLGVHLSIAQSLNAGNFPPQVPYFAGAPLVYHWFADFHAAIAAKAAGIFSIPPS